MSKSPSQSQSQSKNFREHANELADLLAPHVETARGKAAPLLADAKLKAAPLLADAKEKAGPAVAGARDRLTTEVLPVLTAAVAAAGEATEELRSEAMRRGAATAAALRGEVEAPEKGHRFRRLLILLGLGGVVAGVVKKMSDRQPSTAWQSDYTAPASGSAAGEAAPATPTSATTPTSTPAFDETPTATAAAAATASAPPATDEAAAGPDEAVADATEEPHVATDPDNPAEEIQFKRD